MRKLLAIIGASTGQLPLCKKAQEMGLETFCFAWPEGAVCKDHVDHYIPVSILEKDRIVKYCKDNKIDGVVSNTSDLTASIVSYVAEKLGKIGVGYQVFRNIRDKSFVRGRTDGVPGLSVVKYKVGTYQELTSSLQGPYVIKPIEGSAKKGVNYIDGNIKDIVIPEELKKGKFIAEEYINGREYSVESISYNNQHEIIQITEKINTGSPHFVELEHHQPAILSISVKEKIKKLIPQILSNIGFTNGASHIEIKIDDKDSIYLVEVNPRGGGDYISNDLVSLSTDCDYLKQMILVSLGMYKPVPIHNIAYSGIYFLSAYSAHVLPYFNIPKEKWMIRRERINKKLTASCSNYDRDGYIIYRSNKKIII